MSLTFLPQVATGSLPPSMAPQVERLEGLEADTTFHRYVAHSATASDFYWGDFYGKVFYAGSVPVRTKEVARLALAVLSGCMTCREGDVRSALVQGLTQEQVDGVLALDATALPPSEQAVLDLACRLSPFTEEQVMTQGEWDRLRGFFDDEQLSELLVCTSVLSGVGRMLTTMGFVPKVCEIPG